MKANTIAMVALLAAWVAGPAGGEVGSEGRVEMAPVAPEPPAAPTAPAARVARATFTTGVIDREPQDSIRSISNDNVEIFFFSEIRDGSGATIIHRWEWNGQMMAEVPFEVGGPRWRIFSSKTLDPSWLGEWTVLLVDAAGQVLSRESFRYTEAEAPSPMLPDPKVPGA